MSLFAGVNQKVYTPSLLNLISNKISYFSSQKLRKKKKKF